MHKYLEGIFEEIKKELEGDHLIRQIVGSSEKIVDLMDSQRDLLMDYLEDWESSAKDFSKRFEETYSNMDVPYTVIAWNLERIKGKLIEKLITEGYSQEFVIKMRRYLENLLDQVARIYLKKDVEKLAEVKNSPFSEKVLYKTHADWLEKIVECIKKEDFSDFPLVSAKECPFSEALHYPEALFVCLDANMCNYIHNLHAMIHDTANTLYAFYTKGRFFQAYRVFKDLVELVTKLLKTISELYFLAFSDQESNFFRLAHGISMDEGVKYVSLIDVANLGSINRTFGEKVGDTILSEVEKRLRDVFKEDSERTLIVRGVTANFFMLNVGYTQEDLKRVIERLSRDLSFEYRFNGKTIPVNVTLVTVELEPFLELIEVDLRNILFYLKEEAKQKHEKTNFSFGLERRNQIIAFLHEKYRNIEKVKQKIENKEIDLVFHPIVHTKDPGEVFALESLVRIVDGEKLVPAGVFIDLIYELDLIEKLDEAVLDKVLSLKEEILKVTDTVFVNVSPKSLLSDRFVEKMVKTVKEAGGLNIVFELTEQAILENTDVVTSIHSENGVFFAVDDFGSGYSNLKTVAQMADRGILKAVKIDGSLIKDLERSEILKKVVDIISSLSKTLNTYSVAEFVETPSQLDLIRDLKIDFAQGYLFTPPKEIQDILAWAKQVLKK